MYSFGVLRLADEIFVQWSKQNDKTYVRKRKKKKIEKRIEEKGKKKESCLRRVFSFFGKCNRSLLRKRNTLVSIFCFYFRILHWHGARAWRGKEKERERERLRERETESK